jgi:hypothetical protein
MTEDVVLLQPDVVVMTVVVAPPRSGAVEAPLPVASIGSLALRLGEQQLLALQPADLA